MDAPSEAPAGARGAGREADDPEARATFDRAERAVFDANMRTAASMVAAVAATWSVALAHLFPQTTEITGVSFARVAALVLVADASMLAAWLAFRTWGHASAAYRVSDLAETATIQLVLGLLITPAGDALSPLWLFYIGHVLIVGSAPGSDRWHVAAVLVTPVWVALVSIVGHGSTTAAVGAVCALAVAWLVLVIVGGSRRRLSDLAFERTQLERRISGLRVEAERGRIARELHDGLTADLTAIAWRAAVLAKAPPDQGATEFGAIARRARAAIDDTRAMVWALRDDQVPWDVLLAHVRSRCVELCEGRVALDCDMVEGDHSAVAGQVAVDVVRIVQEAVRNALQHAAPKRIRVALTIRDELVIEVEDDGVGIADAPARPGLAHAGLHNLRRRAEQHGGVVEVSPRAPGTSVVVRWPFVVAA